MESEWFILKKNEHLGPFTQAQLQQMFKAEQIGGQDQIWKEGWNEAKSFSQGLFSDSPPPLPELPELPAELDQIEIKPSVKVPVKPLKKKVQKIQLGKQVKPSKDQTRTIKVVRKQKKLTPNFKLPFEVPFDVQFKFEITKTHSLIMGAMALFFAGFFYAIQEIKSPSVFSRPAHMSTSSYKRMARAVVKPGKPRAVAALSDDKKNLWLGVNTPLMGEVDIVLKSLNNKTLRGRSSFRAKGYLKDRLIEVTSIQFDSGTRVVEGYYKAEITSTENMQLPWWTRFAGKQIKHFQYQGDVLISSLSTKRFKKQLAKVMRKRKNNSQRFWEELIQKYQTVMMITGQIKDGFNVIFESPTVSWKDMVPGFENEYKSKYGIFFTEFVKANEDSYNKIYKKKFEDVNDVLASYNHLSKLATEIGEHSMYILEQLQNFKGDDTLGVKLKEEALAKINSIISRCKTKAELLTKTLQ